MVAVEAGAGGSIFRLGEGEVVLVVVEPLLLGALLVDGLVVVVVVVVVVVEVVPEVSLVVPEPLVCSSIVPVPSWEVV
jgi:hypothetical protein